MNKPTADDILTMFEEKQLVDITETMKKNFYYGKNISFIYVAEGNYTYKEAKRLAKELNQIELLGYSNWRIPTENQLWNFIRYNRINTLNIMLNKPQHYFRGIINSGIKEKRFVWSNTRMTDTAGRTIGHRCMNFDDDSLENMFDEEKCKVFLIA